MVVNNVTSFWHFGPYVLVTQRMVNSFIYSYYLYSKRENTLVISVRKITITTDKNDKHGCCFPNEVGRKYSS